MVRRPFRSIRFVPLCAASGAALLLAACAATPSGEAAGLRPALAASTAPDADAEWRLAAGSAEGEPKSLYGLFLAGQAALDRGSSQDAADFLAQASEASPDPYLKERAFTAAVIAGEIGRAAAIQLDAADADRPAERLQRLVRAVDELAQDHGSQALALLNSLPANGSTAQAAVLLKPWAAAAAGDWDTALAPSVATGQDVPRLTSLFAAFGRARLLERAGKMKAAEAELKPLTVNADNVTFVLGYGAFLERRKRRDEAVALYERTLAKTRDAEVIAARDRAKAGRAAPRQLSLQEGAGHALIAPALMLTARRQPELGLAVMRLALRLDPELDEAWMAVGDAMASAGDPDAARHAFSRVSLGSSNYGAALSRIAWSFEREGEKQQALDLAQGWLGRSPDDPQALALYADLLRENGRFAESVAQLDKLIDRGGGTVEPWRLYFMRGVAYERSGRWDKAEPDLRKALGLKPDEPDVMNYLGFGWANRHQNLDEALTLLQKAANARPRSGAIRDSLGWAKYRLGRYADAVQDLERAAQLQPAEADINDHLGDAYWRVGRKLEAQFQWRRVLTLDPDEALRAAAEKKLKLGLDGAEAAPAAVAAAAPLSQPSARP